MKKNSNGSSGEGFMLKLAGFIVDKRNLIFLIFGILIIFSLFSRNWVEVQSDLTTYLPDNSDTRRGLNAMGEFTTFGTAQLMFANVTYDEADALREEIEGIDGVQSVTFDDSTDHYNNASALYTVTFDYDESDDRCLDILDSLTEAYAAHYDVYVSTDLGNAAQESILSEISVIMVYVAFIVVAVLLLTSDTYAEIPVLILTFLSAMIINMGTNFLLGEISNISNSVSSILQLALSLDYAVILCNRYKEEHQALPAREAAVVALSKAIPEISSSSLTTIGGLSAMMFMQFKIGADLAICLIKAILLALLTVFFLMPGLLVVFAPLMDKTKHKNFVPKIPFAGKFAYATRKLVPPIFVAVAVAAMACSGNCPYVYGYGQVETPKLNDTQIAENMIEENFTSSNMVAVVVPTGNYEAERALMDELETYDQVDSCLGLANVEAMDGYMLTDKLTPRQFAELTDVDYELCQLLYTAYATDREEYGKIVGGISSYSVPLMDMFLFVHDCVDEGYVTLDDDVQETLDVAYTAIHNAQLQLKGEHYSRMLVFLDLPEGGEETYAFLDVMKETARKYYPDGEINLAGNSTSDYDFHETFATDNTVVNIVTILIVLVVLLFTFRSVGMPVLLILVIQGSIWINFSFPVFTGTPIFFMSYLVVSSIQMGANIDYAIVIASRFMELKDKMPKKEAIIETMNLSFPTIITSGSILTAAGVLIGMRTSDDAIVGIGQSLGRGTIISIILVMFVLPQILLLGEKIIDSTSFSVRGSVIKPHQSSGRVRVDGMVYGEISGTVYGVVHALVDGNVDVKLVSGSVTEAGGTAEASPPQALPAGEEPLEDGPAGEETPSEPGGTPPEDGHTEKGGETDEAK